MIDFYVLTSPNVQKIFIMLEELELPYRPIPVDVWKGDHFTSEFGALNPNRKIPVIVDHEGPGGKPYTVFESGAILMYLADKTGRFLPADMARRYEVIQWLMIQLTGVGPTFGQVVHFTRFAPPGNDYSVSRHRTEMLRLYDVLETRLSAVPVSRRRGIFDRRHRDLPVDAQSRRPGREMGRPPQSRALVRRDIGAPRGEARARQGRRRRLQPRHRDR